jgi:peptidoglycan-N-acetylglucosamine deacetylase
MMVSSIIFWLAVLFGIGSAYFGLPWIISKIMKWRLATRVGYGRILVLTFDDGPGRRLTPDILRILAEYKAKATFFLLGRNIPGREDIVGDIANNGHDICAHGYDHLHYWKVSPIRAIKDIRKCWKLIDSTLGVRQENYCFRPPYGKNNLFTLLYLLWKRVPVVYWTFDIKDTWESGRMNPDSMAERLKKTNGAVVLAHDFDRKSLPEIDKYVLESLRAILVAAKEHGMQILTVSELIGRQTG